MSFRREKASGFTEEAEFRFQCKLGKTGEKRQREEAILGEGGHSGQRHAESPWDSVLCVALWQENKVEHAD